MSPHTNIRILYNNAHSNTIMLQQLHDNNTLITQTHVVTGSNTCTGNNTCTCTKSITTRTVHLHLSEIITLQKHIHVHVHTVLIGLSSKYMYMNDVYSMIGNLVYKES